MILSKLQEEYLLRRAKHERFCNALFEQINELLRSNQITLAVPAEHRVKSWDSIESKIERLGLKIEHIEDIDDLVGIRAIALFRRDLERARSLLAISLNVIREEDTSERLGVVSFGYQSWHYIVGMPDSWHKVPSLRDFHGLKAEVQLRTVAQHLWAAASHQLQYKVESTVPPPIRRTIHRVSALLETIDLEFERVLQEREAYLQTSPADRATEDLNVDVLAEILDAYLPPLNKKLPESYADLLIDLQSVGVTQASSLKALIEKHREKSLGADKTIVSAARETGDYTGTTKDRIDKGVYFTHVGLTRDILDTAFGSSWRSKTSLTKKKN